MDHARRANLPYVPDYAHNLAFLYKFRFRTILGFKSYMLLLFIFGPLKNYNLERRLK